MQRITITQFEFSPTSKQFVGSINAVLVIDDDGHARAHSGQEAWLKTRVMDWENGASIGVQDDPARWTALLPETLNSGDLEVTVDEISSGQDLPLPDTTTGALTALSAVVRANDAAH